jgi:hypothetical protein
VAYPTFVSAGNKRITPENARKQAWIVWAGLLMGMLAFAGVAVALGSSRAAAAEGPDLPWAPIAGGFLVVAVTGGFLLRRTFWSRAEKDGAVPAYAWMTGNIILWALIEGPTFFGLISVFLRGIDEARFVPPLLGILTMVAANPGSTTSRLEDSPASERADPYASRSAGRQRP